MNNTNTYVVFQDNKPIQEFVHLCYANAYGKILKREKPSSIVIIKLITTIDIIY